MESSATPKTSPRWRRRNLLKKKAETAQRKNHCTSPVGTTRESIQEPILAAAMSRPSEDTVQECDEDQEDVELQESDADDPCHFPVVRCPPGLHPDVVDSEVVMERLREWISAELERDDQKKVAVLLFQVCIQLGLRVKEASSIAGELVGKTECTVREWRQDIFVTAAASASTSAESMFVHPLSMMRLQGRMQSSLLVLERSHLPPPTTDAPVPFVPQANESDKKYLVIIHHDESIFHANDDQIRMWGEPDTHMIRPKSRGAGLMISDFVDGFNGYLQLSSAEYDCLNDDNKAPISKRDVTVWGRARGKLKFMSQVGIAKQIARAKYPQDKFHILLLFDHSSGHTAMPADALVATRMNVSDVGAQPKTHDTIMPGGRVQKMETTPGEAKGVRSVLTERGINCVTLKKDDMITILSQHDNFRDEKTIIESYLLSKGHSVMFFHKFHVK